MANQPYARGTYAQGICQRCGFACPYLKLRFEPLSAQGVPSTASSNLKVCPECFDQTNPQAFLPLAIAKQLPDPQQLHDPRPDTHPKDYPVIYTPASATAGTTASLIGRGVFGGYSASAFVSDPGITIQSVSLFSPLIVTVVVSIDPSTPAGQYLITITGQNDESLPGIFSVAD